MLGKTPGTRKIVTGARLGLIAGAAALVLSGCSGQTTSGGGDATGEKPVKIGISQFVQHDALDVATKGFKEAVIAGGYEEGKTVIFDEQNANGEQPTAVTIAQKFADAGLDLVIGIATPSAQALVQAVAGKPVLFTAVTDPVSAKLVKSNDKPGANVTGTSDAAPVKEQIELVKKLVPDVKKIGVVYNQGEVNSVTQVKQAREVTDKLGIEIVDKGVTGTNEVAQATEALGDVDAIYVITDNTVTSSLPALAQVAETKKIPVVGADSNMAGQGATIAMGVDYYDLGKQVGEMAVDILKNGKKAGDIPVGFSKNFMYKIDKERAEKIGLVIPDDILAQADTV